MPHYENEIRRLLPSARLGYVPDFNDSLAALGTKFSEPVTFHDAEVTIAWNSILPGAESFAQPLAEAVLAKAQGRPQADAEFGLRST